MTTPTTTNVPIKITEYEKLSEAKDEAARKLAEAEQREAEEREIQAIWEEKRVARIQKQRRDEAVKRIAESIKSYFTLDCRAEDIAELIIAGEIDLVSVDWSAL